VEEVTGAGKTDEARLSNYLNDLSVKGVKEISIISNAKEIVASTNPSKVGQPLTHKKKELIIKAELGEPVSEEGNMAYNVILPVVAGDTQYGYIHLKINRDDFSHILRANTIKRIVATVSVFGIGIIIALVLSRHYTRPIHKVVNAARRVAAGDFNQSIPVQSKDEIGQLAESFNLMVHNLKEGRILEQRLRETEHLSGLGQLSRDMAHEIRNPLNFINLSVAHLAEKYKQQNSEKQEKFEEIISGIKQEIQRLDKLVNEFLDYSRPIKLNKQKVRIDKHLEDVISLIWAKAEADGIAIVKDYRKTPELEVDPDLFKSCVLNLVTNAFHAMETTNAEKVLKIVTVVLEGRLVLTVEDSGKGVAPEDLSRIFEPFFSTRQNGLGLGLPMTKRVIEEHGGKVVFESQDGKGSKVSIVLPLNGIQDENAQIRENADLSRPRA
jgi:nitrogen fixation/metabolism regulation signal transduction histidine kinase